TRKAMLIAFNAHNGQLDKAGVPYIYHPIHVAESMPDELTTCVALLHDVLEDSEITIHDLIKEGFSEDVIDALSVLTHNKSVSYMDYIKEINKNPIARKVKLADLAHNSDLTRLDIVTDKDRNRSEKYKKAIAFLEYI
ncbi:MAG: HD domain-containing protein, partial [Candidatus Ornithomonoglobus sp.]